MQDLDVGPLPVCGEGDRLVGMLTDRDITIRAVARGLDPRTTKVRDVMSKGIHYCLVDDAVEDAAREMKRHRIRRLVVLQRDKKLAGIVSIGDLAVETHDPSLVGSTLEAISA